MEADGYELLGVDGGRRVERFGPRVVDRPAPGVRDDGLTRQAPTDLPPVDLRFDRYAGWTGTIDPWEMRWQDLRLELRPTPSGQVGIFPEHAALWPALRAAATRRPGAEILNLFAYTGAATLVLAAAGGRVTHVDGSRPAVAWARRNAGLSDLGDRPVRWIVDDVETFVGRELRRGRRYHGIVLDPPSWGHGSGRGRWRLEDRLEDLLAALARLCPRPIVVALTAHTPDWPADRLAAALDRAFGRRPGSTGDAGSLDLVAPTGGRLPLGEYACLTDAA